MSNRRRITSLTFFLVLAANISGCRTLPTTQNANTVAVPAPKVDGKIRPAMIKIAPFFKPMGPPKRYDWLGSHNEPGQTFDEYLASGPTVPTRERQKIYVLPLGSFTKRQTQVIETTAGYVAAFFDLPVETLLPKPFNAEYPNFRYNDSTHTRQVKTGYILNDVLSRLLPDDAAALIAFTNDDLYPDASMNYVFGQADMEKRVGVWSLKRLEAGASQDVFLHRTLKIAVHETGHMFSMKHCTKYECVMSGTNQLTETDSRPIDACPECMAKVCWFSDIEPKLRYERLAGFCRRNGLGKDARDFELRSKAVD